MKSLIHKRRDFVQEESFHQYLNDSQEKNRIRVLKK